MRHKEIEERNMFTPAIFVLSRSGKVAIGTPSYWEAVNGYYVSSKSKDPHPTYGLVFYADDVEYVSLNGKVVVLTVVPSIYLHQFKDMSNDEFS